MENKSFQILEGNGYITVRLLGSPDNSTASVFDTELQKHLVDPLPHIVINCESLSGLSSEWVRVLLKVVLFLKKYNKQVRMIILSPALLAQFKKDGIDTAFKYSPNLREALVEFGLVTKKMLDTDFINPFLNATLHVLNVQASIKAEAGKIFLKKENEKFVGDISGVIGIVSESFNGSVVISFPEKTFLNVMSGMLGEEYTELNKEIIDGAGEITNMIFGQAKIVLNEKGYGIKTAIPSVVAGKDHSLLALTKGPVVVVPFKSSGGDFFIEICVST
ncbi:MAG: chemotaxis protein CheX [Bacteriovoracaceae bacterium]